MTSTVRRELLEDCVRAATLAPSLHNSQPWRFRIGAGSVELYADPSRRLDVLDPHGRELLISVGAALFTLRLSLNAAGLPPVAELFPEPGEPDLVARVGWGEPVEVPDAVVRLADAVPLRHTNRYPFTGEAIPADAVEQLTVAAGREHARLTVANHVARNAIIALSQAAERQQRATGGYRAELARWTTGPARRGDGIPTGAFGPWHAVEVMPIRDFGLMQPHLARPAEPYEPYPSFLVLATTGDDRAAWVAAGQALQRVLLTATTLGLATTPISQAVEVPTVRERLTDTAGGVWAQMILRAGYGRPASATPRRPLAEVLLPEAAGG